MNTMDIVLMPESLRNALGEQASKDLINLFDQTTKATKEKVLETTADRIERHLTDFKAEVKVEIAGVKAEVSNVKADLIKWIFVFWIGQIAVLSGIVTLLIK